MIDEKAFLIILPFIQLIGFADLRVFAALRALLFCGSS